MSKPKHGPAHQAFADSRLRLRPRDYFALPRDFGRNGAARTQVPGGGDAESMQAALIQHQLVVLAAGGDLLREGKRFGVSIATVGRIRRGERWAGQLGLSVLLEAGRRGSSRRRRSPR